MRKTRNRAKTGEQSKTSLLIVRCDPALLVRLDLAASRDPGRPTRSEVARRIIMGALASEASDEAA